MKNFTMIWFALILCLTSTLTQAQNPNFRVADNGVTCLCPDAAVGETGTLTIDGEEKTFTKRTEQQLRDLIAADQTDPQIALTCTSGITNMNNMFYNESSFNQDIGSWDVSNVTEMKIMFSGARSFNQDIGSWNVGSVTSMRGMFNQTNVFNQDVSSWDVGKVIDMRFMFQYADSFNQDIGSWDVNKVIDMGYMFLGATIFNQDLTGWCVENIGSKPSNFDANSALTAENNPIWGTCPIEASNFTLADNGVTCLCPDAAIGETGILTINGVQKTFTKRTEQQLRDLIAADYTDPQIALTCTSGITDMSSLFRNTSFNQDIGSWDVSNVTDMYQMYFLARSFNQNIGSWIVSNVTNMSEMFLNAHNFNQDIGSWDVGKVNDMTSMFGNAFNFNQDIGSWNVGNVTAMSNMFSGASRFNQDIGSWDVGKVTNMRAMFNSASSFNQDIGSWDVGNVINMSFLFNNANVFNQDIGSWDISKVDDMSYMFKDAINFNQNLTEWCVENIGSKPSNFDANSALAAENLPIWGTCPVVQDYSFNGSWSSNPMGLDIGVGNIAINTGSVSTSGTTTTTGNLTIANGAELVVASGTTLNVGNIIIESGGLLRTINTPNINVSGEVTYKRNLATDNWYLMSSPVGGLTFNDTFVTNNNIAFGSGTNRGVSNYYTTTNNWAYLQAGSSINTVTAQGFGLKLAESGEVSFSGNLAVGNLTLNLSGFWYSPPALGNGFDERGNGFILIGNPYAANINSATILTQNTSNLDTETIWVWNQNLGGYETKVTGQSFILAPTQGFFVRTTDTAVQLSIPESAQTNTNGTFQKSSVNPTALKLWVTNGKIQRYAQIYYTDKATKGFDNGWDGETFGGLGDDNFDVYTKLVSNTNEKNYQIQSLPLQEIETLVVPVGINAKEDSILTFSSENVNFPQGVKLYLEDRDNNTFVQLDQPNSKYDVAIEQDYKGVGRFYLHTTSETLNTNTFVKENIDAFLLNDQTLRISGIQSKTYTVKLVNILGKQLFTADIDSSSTTDVVIPKLSKGVYLISIQTNTRKYFKKIILE